MKLIKLVFLLLGLQAHLLSAQDRPFCVTYEHEQQQKKQNPTFVKFQAAQEAKLQRWLTQTRALRRSNTVITIPVVVHVVYNQAEQNISEAQIRSQIAALNQDYRRLNADTSLTPTYFRPVAADTRIQFSLAQQDSAGNPTLGITRRFTPKAAFLTNDSVKFTAGGGTNGWDSNQYLNIWVGNFASGVLGYAQSPGVGSAKTDGVVINYRYFGTVGSLAEPFHLGRTTTHEVGHWLGLKHIWGDASCGDDLVADTPTQASFNVSCKPFPFASCNNYSDMFMNYMDYSFDDCMNLFTQGQRDRMRATLNTTRIGLLTSPGAVPLHLTAADERIFKLFPNPTTGLVYMESYLPTASLRLRVLDAVGKVMAEREMKQLTPQRMNVDLSGLANGVYIIQVTTPALLFTKRMVLAH